MAERKSSTKRPTLAALRATITKLSWQIFALKGQISDFETLLEDANVSNAVKALKARRLTKARKLLENARVKYAGYKRTDILWSNHIAENLRRHLKNPRGAGQKPLDIKDHYDLLVAISHLDRKDQRSKLAMARALRKTEQYKHLGHEKSVYKRIDNALKFFRNNPNSILI